jgi:hypothetical protein
VSLTDFNWHMTQSYHEILESLDLDMQIIDSREETSRQADVPSLDAAISAMRSATHQFVALVS